MWQCKNNCHSTTGTVLLFIVKPNTCRILRSQHHSQFNNRTTFLAMIVVMFYSNTKACHTRDKPNARWVSFLRWSYIPRLIFFAPVVYVRGWGDRMDVALSCNEACSAWWLMIDYGRWKRYVNWLRHWSIALSLSEHKRPRLYGNAASLYYKTIHPTIFYIKQIS